MDMEGQLHFSIWGGKGHGGGEQVRGGCSADLLMFKTLKTWRTTHEHPAAPDWGWGCAGRDHRSSLLDSPSGLASTPAPFSPHGALGSPHCSGETSLWMLMSCYGHSSSRCRESCRAPASSHSSFSPSAQCAPFRLEAVSLRLHVCSHSFSPL